MCTGLESIVSLLHIFGRELLPAEDIVFHLQISHATSGTCNSGNKLNFRPHTRRVEYTFHWARRSSSICFSPNLDGSCTGIGIHLSHMLLDRQRSWTSSGNNHRFLNRKRIGVKREWEWYETLMKNSSGTHLSSWSTRSHWRYSAKHLYTSTARSYIPQKVQAETHIVDSCNTVHRNLRLKCRLSTSHLPSWNIHHDKHIGRPTHFAARKWHSEGNQHSHDKHCSSLKTEKRSQRHCRMNLSRIFFDECNFCLCGIVFTCSSLSWRIEFHYSSLLNWAKAEHMRLIWLWNEWSFREF